MKNLGHIYTDKADLELIECDCGFHVAVDSTQIDEMLTFPFPLTCPGCNTAIDVGDVLDQEVEA